MVKVGYAHQIGRDAVSAKLVAEPEHLMMMMMIMITIMIIMMMIMIMVVVMMIRAMRMTVVMTVANYCETCYMNL